MRVDWKRVPNCNGWADFTEEGLQPFEVDKERKCIYLIWSEERRQMVYVGSGDVSRLWDHLNPHDPNYENITSYGGLKATYAIVNDENQMLGAENYLAQVYDPLVGERHPQDQFEEVNLPSIDVSYHCDRVSGISDGGRNMRSLMDTLEARLQ